MSRGATVGTLCVAIGLGGLATIEGAPAAHAAGGWTLVASPQPTRVQQAGLLSVACVSPTACVAVGYRDTASMQTTHAELWNGARWSVMTTQNVGSDWRLDGVACAQVTRCFAVGNLFSYHTPPVHPIVEQWDGTQWSVISVPMPGAAYSEWLYGISCGAPTSCTAVGEYNTTAHEHGRLIERWDGGSWTVETSPSPSPRHISGFRAVSCTSATDCTAVGHAQNAAGDDVPVIERRTSAGWSITTPAGLDDGVLASVSCADTWHCLVVGDAFRNPNALAWSGRGGVWTPANPGDAYGLNAVACITATDCVVSEDTDAGSEVLRWQNGAWSQDTIQSPRDRLNAIACAAHSCQAVGVAGGEVPFHRRSQGTSWVAVAAGKPTGPAGIFSNGVSCGSPNRCLAVGSSYAAAGALPFAMLWDGASWHVVSGTTAVVPAGDQGVFQAVSCAAATDCMVVGNIESPSKGSRALAAHWDGSRWSATTFANIPVFNGVACTSTTDCTAVGYGPIERWNGSTWHAGGTNVAAHIAYINGIACRSASDCNAVGTGEPMYPAAAHRSGDAWTLRPVQRANDLAWLWSVSCPASNNCIAVGFYDPTDALVSGAIAEHWDGAHWTLTQPVFPYQENGGPAALTSVSCASTTSCWAVGGFGPATAQFWDGSHWWQATLPASVRELDAVSCEASRPCIAVGGQALLYR